MQFVKGDPAPLSAVSSRFAEFYGAERNAVDMPQTRASAIAVSERMVEQYRKYPEAFERAMDTYGADSDGLRRAALDHDLPFYTFVYGIPVPVASVTKRFFTVVEAHVGIHLGGMEPDIFQLTMDQLRHDKPGALISFENYYIVLSEERFTEYNIRSLFCQQAFKNRHAYSLLLAGAQPGLLVNADFENGNILMSTLLGADINFALAAYGRDRELDPRLVARACRDGVAVEYVGAL